MLNWALRNRAIDEKPFTLERHRPLEQIYLDDHPHKVVMKPAQVGVSEWAISLACWALDVGAQYWNTGKKGLNVAYLFPTQTALSDFVKERFSGLQQESYALATLFTDYDDIGFKQAGASYLYLRGAWTTKGLKSFPADLLIFDEYDEMLAKAVALAEKRLRASVVRRQVKISTPTLPGRGIHAEYMRSDQHVWEVLCDACSEFHELEFFRDVKADGADWDEYRYWDEDRLRAARMTVTCPGCRAEIDRCGEGRWRAKEPQRTAEWEATHDGEKAGIRGYHVPALCFPSVSLMEIAIALTSNDPSKVTEAYRSDLGLPYEAEGSQVTEPMLKQLSVKLEGGELPAVEWRDTTMGVDVGARFHYRISSLGPDNVRYVREMSAVRSWAELTAKLDELQVRLCVIDAMPELNACKDWAEANPGRVVRAFYPNSTNLKGELYQPEKEKALEDGVVNINRTMAMDAVYALIAKATERWPAKVHNDPEVIAHMKAPIRVLTNDERGQEKATWEHTAPDHLYHASVYDLIAGKLLPEPTPPATVVIQHRTTEQMMGLEEDTSQPSFINQLPFISSGK